MSCSGSSGGARFGDRGDLPFSASVIARGGKAGLELHVVFPAALRGRFGAHFPAEYTFMNNEVERAGFGGANTPATGNVNLRALMFNAYYDLDLPFTVWKPYVGAGIGIYQLEINSLYPDFFVGIPVLEDQPVNTTSDMPLAYQFRAGASRPLGERTEFFAGYRYFRGEELTFASIPFAAPGAPTFHPEGADVHSAEFGLRIRF